MTAETKCISRNDILQSTLFHIQIKQCQYIDNFPEKVTSIIDNAVGKKKLKKYRKPPRSLQEPQQIPRKITALRDLLA